MNRREFLHLTGAAAAMAAARHAPAAGPAEARPFLTGGDVSLLAKIEDAGGVYRQDGRPKEPLAIFRDHGANTMRLRIFHSPNGRGAVVNDLAYTRRLTRRIKAAGLHLLLDFHYSDTWADPGHQTKPKAWRDLTPGQLEQTVFDYTRDVVAALKADGALPDVVQVGNEITPGMLWDTGRVGGRFDTPEQWRQLAALVKSGVRAVKEAGGDLVRTMIHVDRGGTEGVTRWFFDHLLAEGVTFDLVGLSYYAWWHGPMEGLRRNLAATAERYRKDIVLVETAFPWTAEEVDGKPNEFGREPGRLDSPHKPTPAGQKAFLEELVRVVRQAPDGRGRGVLYWAPEWIPAPGVPGHWAHKALFDRSGNVLPGMAAFRA